MTVTEQLFLQPNSAPQGYITGELAPAALPVHSRDWYFDARKFPPKTSEEVIQIISTMQLADSLTAELERIAAESAATAESDIEVLRERTKHNVVQLDQRAAVLNEMSAALGELTAGHDTDEQYIAYLQRQVRELETRKAKMPQAFEAATVALDTATTNLHAAAAEQDGLNHELATLTGDAKQKAVLQRQQKLAEYNRQIEEEEAGNGLTPSAALDLLEPADKTRLQQCLQMMVGEKPDEDQLGYIRLEYQRLMEKAAEQRAQALRSALDPQIQALNQPLTHEEIEQHLTPEQQVAYATKLQAKEQADAAMQHWTEQQLGFKSRIVSLTERDQSIDSELKQIASGINHLNAVQNARAKRFERLVTDMQAIQTDLAQLQAVNMQQEELHPIQGLNAASEVIAAEHRLDAEDEFRFEIIRHLQERREAIRQGREQVPTNLGYEDGATRISSAKIRLGEGAAVINSTRTTQLKPVQEWLAALRTVVIDSATQTKDEIAMNHRSINERTLLAVEHMEATLKSLKELGIYADTAHMDYHRLIPVVEEAQRELSVRSGAVSQTRQEKDVTVNQIGDILRQLAEAEAVRDMADAASRADHAAREAHLYSIYPEKPQSEIDLILERHEADSTIVGPQEYDKDVAGSEAYKQAQAVFESLQTAHQELVEHEEFLTGQLAHHVAQLDAHTEVLSDLNSQQNMYSAMVLPKINEQIKAHIVATSAGTTEAVHLKSLREQRPVIRSTTPQDATTVHASESYAMPQDAPAVQPARMDRVYSDRKPTASSRKPTPLKLGLGKVFAQIVNYTLHGTNNLPEGGNIA